MKSDDEQRGRAEADDEVERLLAGAGAYERSSLAESRRIEDAPGAARVRATLEREWAAERRSTRSRYGLAAAAVLTLMLGAWWFFARDTGGGPAGVNMGREDLVIVAPQDEFDVIRWRSKTHDPDARYHLRVVDADTGAELLVRRDLPGTEFSLQDVPTDAWRNIEIELEERGGDGATRAIARALARRSSR
jgi:hypothetical protein